MELFGKIKIELINRNPNKPSKKEIQQEKEKQDYLERAKIEKEKEESIFKACMRKLHSVVKQLKTNENIEELSFDEKYTFVDDRSNLLLTTLFYRGVEIHPEVSSSINESDLYNHFKDLIRKVNYIYKELEDFHKYDKFVFKSYYKSYGEMVIRFYLNEEMVEIKYHVTFGDLEKAIKEYKFEHSSEVEGTITLEKTQTGDYVGVDYINVRKLLENNVGKKIRIKIS